MPVGKPQQGVHVGLLQQLPPHGLAGAALEQHVVGDDDGAAAVDLEQALDVLEEVQLLVLGRGPEVGPLVGLVLLLQVALFVHDGDRRFLAERRIGQEQAHPVAVAGRARQAVLARDDGARVGVDPVEHQVHDAEPGRVRDEFPAPHEAPLQVLLLVGVEVLALVPHHVIMSVQEKAPRAASGVAERVCRCRSGAIHDRLDEFSGREILPRPLRTFGGALREQPLVDVALHIRLHRHPLFGLDEIHDQAAERDRVLDLRLRLLEDLAEHSRLRAEMFEDVAILGLQGIAFLAEQARPVIAGRDDRLPVVGRLRLLVRHLEEEQERDLLHVGHVAQAVVPEDVGEVPGFADDLLGVGAHDVFDSGVGA